MGELRKDPTRGRWVLVRPRRRIDDDGECVLCPGAEGQTAPEIAAYRKEGSPPNSPGWQVRVVPETDPYFRVELDLVREGVGMYDKITPRGASEILVESPRHDDTLATMSLEQLDLVLWMYRDRLLDLKRDFQIRDILVSRHYRKTGVTTHHPYSRITAIPIVFDETREELKKGREYYQYKRRCLYCDMVREEIAVEERLLQVTRHFVALVPYASRVPLEAWILPRHHGCLYEEALTRESSLDLARLVSGYFRTLAASFGDPSWELALHSAPNLNMKILQSEWATVRDDYHWHIEIVAQAQRANRLGGIYINDSPPEEVAAQLRRAWRA